MKIVLSARVEADIANQLQYGIDHFGRTVASARSLASTRFSSASFPFTRTPEGTSRTAGFMRPGLPRRRSSSSIAWTLKPRQSLSSVSFITLKTEPRSIPTREFNQTFSTPREALKR